MKKATNALLMKEKNQKLILRIIRNSASSRADIARKTGLTKAAVTLIVDELISSGYIEEYTSDYVGVGRKPMYLKLKSDSVYSVGVNITRQHFEVGITNINGDIIIIEKFPISSPDKAINTIKEKIKSQIKTSAINPDKILGIGITTPGPVDYKTNTILTPPNFEQWHNIRLDFAPGIHLENIANASALCEKYFGNCSANNNYIMLIVNEGIGSGIIYNGKIYRGHNGRGNEAGHISIDFNGKKCECGNRGCLEKYAAIPAILENSGYSSWKKVIDKNDSTLISTEAQYLSCALTTVVNLFDFSTILLGGDIGYKGEILSQQISDIISETAINRDRINILPVEEKNGVLIAASVIIDDFFTKEGLL